MLRIPKFALILQGGGIFGLRRQYFQVPPIWFHPQYEALPPPSDSVTNGDGKSSLKASPPPKILWKTLLGVPKLRSIEV